MAYFAYKLKLIIWKNCKIRVRHWFLSICEVTIPVLLFLAVAYCRSKADFMSVVHIDSPTYNEKVDSDVILSHYKIGITKLYYAPHTDFTSEIIRRTQLKLAIPTEDIREFKNEAAVIKHYIENVSNATTTMAVIFDGSGTVDATPKQLRYRIRSYERNIKWHTQSGFPKHFEYMQGTGSEKYFHFVFLSLQMALDMSFAEMLSKDGNVPFDITMQEFPYPPYVQDTLKIFYTSVLPLITLWSFMLLCPGVLKRIVEEKSSGIKELMKMMGLHSWMLWIGWFIHALLANIFSIVIIIVLLKANIWGISPIPHTHCCVLFLFVLLYYCATVSFIFAISTLFSKPTLAMCFCIALIQFSYYIPMSFNIISNEDGTRLSLAFKLMLSLLPNMAMVYGYRTISRYESKDVGANFSNLFTAPNSMSNEMTMAHVLFMLIVDVVIYSLLTFYIDSVYPGPYGLPKKWNFIFNSRFVKKLIKYKKVASKSDSETDMLNHDENNSNVKVEAKPENLTAGIEIRNLKKCYRDVNAINGLSMDIYKDQITILLGHNGAGKTTTMNILTGMIPSTSGSVKINGKDIAQDMDEVRKSLGLCTQHNLLFTDLTVKEQLMFFSMLRGVTKREAEAEALQYLNKVNLNSKADVMADELSGGMKRKLSLGIALVGNAKVLMLDEPTSGLDPEARREVWDMLLAIRKFKTMLITTHFLEEADILGDRIAIMDHGNLLCYGSSMYLKKQFGTGYHLSMVRDEKKCTIDNANDQLENITKCVQLIIPDARLDEAKGNSLKFTLPTESTQEFPRLFKQLESKQDDLGIVGIGIAVTTLDDVFLRVGSLVADANNTSDFPNDSICQENGPEEAFVEVVETKQSSLTLFLQQIKTLFYKRFITILRSKKLLLIQFVTAISLTVATILMGIPTDEADLQEPKLDLTLDGFYANSDVFYSDSNNEIGRFYKSLIASQTGNGIKAQDVSTELIKKGVENLAYYKERLIVAAEFNSSETTINAMYSNVALHGAPISLNLIMNALVQFITNDGRYSISTANEPLPTVSIGDLREQETVSTATIGLLWLTFFPAGPLFFTVLFLSFPLYERVSKIKQLQLMTGISSFTYWTTCYLCDLLCYSGLTIILTLIILLCDSAAMFTDCKSIWAFVTIMTAYGLSGTAFSYLFSYKQSAAGGEALLVVVCYMIGVIAVPIVYVMETVDGWNVWGENLKYVGYGIPHFSFVYACLGFSMKAVENYNWDRMPDNERNLICKFTPKPCCDAGIACINYRSYFHPDNMTSIRAPVIAMFIASVLYFALMVFFDTTFGVKCCKKLQDIPFHFWTSKEKQMDRDEVDVAREESSVDEGCRTIREKKKTKEKLLVSKLKKTYRNILAVQKVSFSVKPGECFGLLGVNGAGKTTTFKMLTWDELPSNGDAHIDHTSIKQRKQYLNKTGYCPQVDALNGLLTARELLYVFANLRGIPPKNVDKEVNALIKQLGLKEYQDQPCSTYSGGNKRKLNIALSLIGEPDVIFLDEPTSGVDPLARRKLWNILSNLKKRKYASSFVLTSHSMEECETLCDRLTIMVQGKLRCLGEIPYLKQKYQQGFTVLVKLKCNEQQDVKERGAQIAKLRTDFYKNFGAKIKDEHEGLLHFHIGPMNKITGSVWTWSDLFSQLEKMKETYSIVEEYSLSDTTLEQIFLSFAREYKPFIAGGSEST